MERVKGQSSPEDFAYGLFVGLRDMCTSLADEFCLGGTVLGGSMPAGATVGGVPGVDLDPKASNVSRFGAQYRDEEPQPASLMLRGESPVLAEAPFGK